MNNDLDLIGIKKGCLYETIITTKSIDGFKNAAPFGITGKSKNTVLLRMFKGTTTLKNILETKEFCINITDNSLLFTKSLISNISENEFEKDNSLKSADAYLKCKVMEIKEGIKNDNIKKSELIYITSEVIEIKLNRKTIKVYNRGFSQIIELLIDFSRIDIVNDKIKEDYIEKVQETEKLILKVGSKNEKESLRLIKEKLNEKGFNL